MYLLNNFLVLSPSSSAANNNNNNTTTTTTTAKKRQAGRQAGRLRAVGAGRKMSQPVNHLVASPERPRLRYRNGPNGLGASGVVTARSPAAGLRCLDASINDKAGILSPYSSTVLPFGGLVVVNTEVRIGWPFLFQARFSPQTRLRHRGDCIHDLHALSASFKLRTHKPIT